MVIYKDFEDWFFEIENYGTRAERFWDSLDQFTSDNGKVANIEMWLRAAFESARLELRPCRSPYCECDVGKCTHPGCYDSRGN